MSNSLFIVVLVGLSAFTPRAWADAATAEPGVTATFESLGVEKKPPSSDIRVSRLFALYVAEGAAPTPFTPAARFRATFEGDLTLRLREFLVFSAEGRGKLTVSINGKPVLSLAGNSFAQQPTEQLRLNKGKNHFVAIYESPEKGDSEFRILWSSRTFKPEPIPPSALSHDPAAANLRESQQVREGRFLMGEFRCTKCHATTVTTQNGAMPELSQDAPSLAEAGARFRPAWLVSWISNPRSIRKGAHMPRLFHGGEDHAVDPRAADVAAYLASLGHPSTAPGDMGLEPPKVAIGGRLFTQLDCIACHTLPDADISNPLAPDESRVTLKYVNEKFQPGALRLFLQDPSSHYAWNPMPNFRLSSDEADAIAQYLRSFRTTKGTGDTAIYDGANPNVALAANIDRGKTLVQSVGCLNCHSIEKDSTALKSPSLDELQKEVWTRGCLASDAAARKNAPDFGITPEQADAFRAFASSDRASLNQDNAEEFAMRQMRLLRCTACHARDGAESLLGTIYDMEASGLKNDFPPSDPPNEPMAADQRAPLLTWAGEKLRPRWTEAFVGGKLDYKLRPFLRARMPSFASRAPLLAAGLAAQHGYGPVAPEYPAPDEALATIGQKLCGTTPNASFSCVQCHSVATQPPKAPFEAPSINFMYVTERLRKEYYQRWIHDPLRVDPNTKMPRFDDADDKTGIRDVFDGDAPKQYEAIWEYLLEGRKMLPPP